MTPTPDGPGSPTRLPRWVTRPLSGLYRAEIGRRNRRYDRGVGVAALDRPVVSVGNLSAGGTGKTPVVRWVVGVLRSAGHRPVVAMRGYGAPPGGVSDEEREHRDAMPGVPVVARPDRTAALREHFASGPGAADDCVVLDDGFQHRRLARDLDIVLIDASKPPDRDRLLPEGFLREPPESLARAGAVVITHAELVSASELEHVQDFVRALVRDGVPVAAAEHRWSGLRVVRSGERAQDDAGAPPTEPVGWLGGRRVVAVCAIGHPRGFFDAVDRSGAVRVGERVLPDHDPFREAIVEQMVCLAENARAEAVVLTAKDWAKLADRRIAWPCPVVIPTLDIGFVSGECGLADRVTAAVADHDPRRGG